jgi:hypothetical protein
MLLLKADTSSSAMREALLQACFINEVYDRQCEDSREIYLHKLIIASGTQAFFRDALLQKLNSAADSLQGGPQEVQLGLAQIFAILCLMAAEDGGFDRHDLYAFFDKSPKDLVELCLWPLVRLDGVGGLLRCVRWIHDDVVADYEQNGWIFHCLVETLVERDGTDTAAIELQKARGKVAELDRLMILNEAGRPKNTTLELVDYAAFKRKLDTTGRARGGQNFTEVELIAAANDLLNERESDRMRAYLTIFRKRHFPLSAVELLPLLHHEDRQVASGATWALGNLKDEKVREAAFSVLRDGRLAQAIRLLKSNYRAGDFAVIGAILETAALDDDALHALGSAVLDLVQNDPVAVNEAKGLLIRLYESGRCSLCRRSAVKLLAKADAIPNWMAQELPFDVNANIAEVSSLTTS